MHPWTVVEDDLKARYWDFRANPEHIPEVLEDFKPYAHYPAIQRFYELLTWVNGPLSRFETNDCALGDLSVDHKTPEVVRQAFEADPISIHGRLTIIFRDLTWNTSRGTIDWLKKCLHDQLLHNVPNFPAVIFVGEWPHFFKEIDREGNAVTLQFWAWGDDNEMAMGHLRTTFDVLHQLFEGISNHLDEELKKGSSASVTQASDLTAP